MLRKVQNNFLILMVPTNIIYRFMGPSKACQCPSMIGTWRPAGPANPSSCDSENHSSCEGLSKGPIVHVDNAAEHFGGDCECREKTS